MASFLVLAGDQGGGGDGAILRTCFDGTRNLSLHRVIVSLSAMTVGPVFRRCRQLVPCVKADASEAGEAWSDGEIAEALDTSIDTIARARQKLVEEGLYAALTRSCS